MLYKNRIFFLVVSDAAEDDVIERVLIRPDGVDFSIAKAAREALIRHYHKAKEYIETADIRAMVAADYALGGLQLFIVQMNGEGKRPTLRIFRADEEKTRERIIDDAGRVDDAELCTAMVFPKPEKT